MAQAAYTASALHLTGTKETMKEYCLSTGWGATIKQLWALDV